MTSVEDNELSYNSGRPRCCLLFVSLNTGQGHLLFMYVCVQLNNRILILHITRVSLLSNRNLCFAPPPLQEQSFPNQPYIIEPIISYNLRLFLEYCLCFFISLLMKILCYFKKLHQFKKVFIVFYTTSVCASIY